MSLAGRVRAPIAAALHTLELGDGGERAIEQATWVVERPKRVEHGDLSTNVAMALAKRAGKPPRLIAQALVNALAKSDVIASAEIAGPGFVNLRLHARAFHAELAD